MKTLSKTLLIFIFIGTTFKSGAIDQQWSRTYNGGSNDKGLQVTTEPGFAYLAGISETLAGTKLVNSTYTDVGTLISLNFSNTFLSSSNVKQIERDPSKAMYVLCQNGAESFTLIKYSSNGIEKWRRNFPNLVVKIVVGHSSGVYICYFNGTGVSIRKLNRNNGTINWTRNIADPNLIANTNTSDFTLDPDDNSLFAGTSTEFGTDYDYRLVKVKRNNTLIYNIQFTNPGTRDEVANKIAANSAGELFLVGDFNNASVTRNYFYMVKFSSLGAFLWATQYEISGGPTAAFFPLEVQIGLDGNVVTVGNHTNFFSINPLGEVKRVEVSKFNSVTGAMLFSVFPNAPLGTEDNIKEFANCMSIDDNNDIYFGGGSNTYAGVDVEPNRYMISKVSGIDGTLQWVDASVGGIDDLANQVNDISVTPGYDVYIASTRHLGDNLDMEIAKYCQVGCFGGRYASVIDQPIDFMIYPNPSATSFKIVISQTNDPIQMNIFNIKGELIETKQVTTNELEFGNEYAEGIYFVRMGNNKINKTFKISKINN